MKYLENKTVKTRGPGPTGTLEDRDATYAQLGIELVSINREGMDLKEMGQRQRVIRTLEKSEPGAVMEFEDADAATFAKCVSAARFPIASEGIIQFGEDVTSLPDQKSAVENPDTAPCVKPGKKGK